MIKRQRNYNIDIMRALAVLLVVVYHTWVLAGSFHINIPIVNIFIILGGEIGVTTFFLLSGYGIYSLLSRFEEQGRLKFKNFFPDRIKKIAPQYYLSLVMALLLTDAATYLSKEHIGTILSHIFFIHNISTRYFGAINGVLWTMAIIVQFYIVAIPLYKLLKKQPVLMGSLSVVFTVFVKCLVYVFIERKCGESGSQYYFFAGRQLFTALDNFVLGMLAAYVVDKYRDKMNNIKLGIGGSIILIIGIYVICKLGLKWGIHTNNLSGYLWHSELAICIMMLFIFISMITKDKVNYLGVLYWISENEYGIYLWHLLIFNNLLAKSSIVQSFLAKGYNGVYVVLMTFVACLLGGYMNMLCMKRK